MAKPKLKRESRVVREFSGAKLGHGSRVKRLHMITERLAAQPTAGFPKAMATEAEQEGFYRFVRNQAVTFDGLFQPHVGATRDRMEGLQEVLVSHDTTEFRFGGTRKDLGRLTESGHGFLGHFSLTITADADRRPLGVVAVESWARRSVTPSALRAQGKVSYAQSREMPNEHDRWLRGVDAAEKSVGGTASLIHVMDSEADDYKLMARLVEMDRRWLIRSCYDRVLADEKPGTKIEDVVAKRTVVCTRSAKISARRRKPGGAKRKRARARKERAATLAIRATSLSLRRPKHCKDLPSSLQVNIVFVRERRPPRGEEPLEWTLLTTEPIDTEQQILKIVDFYRARWVIEEYFKALKTGCALEKRQLESWHTLLNATALFIPIAWHLLHLRTSARIEKDAPASLVLTPIQETVLRRASPMKLPDKLTVGIALLAIARLGGHLRSNGDPGWQVLGRGFEDLLLLVAGYRLAQTRNDQS